MKAQSARVWQHFLFRAAPHEQRAPRQMASAEHVFCYRYTFCPSRPVITCQRCGLNFFHSAAVRKLIGGEHMHAWMQLDDGQFQCRIYDRANRRRCQLVQAELPQPRLPCADEARADWDRRIAPLDFVEVAE